MVQPPSPCPRQSMLPKQRACLQHVVMQCAPCPAKPNAYNPSHHKMFQVGGGRRGTAGRQVLHEHMSPNAYRREAQVAVVFPVPRQPTTKPKIPMPLQNVAWQRDRRKHVPERGERQRQKRHGWWGKGGWQERRKVSKVLAFCPAKW